MLSKLHLACTLGDYELLIMHKKSRKNIVNPTSAENLGKEARQTAAIVLTLFSQHYAYAMKSLGVLLGLTCTA